MLLVIDKNDNRSISWKHCTVLGYCICNVCDAFIFISGSINCYLELSASSPNELNRWLEEIQHITSLYINGQDYMVIPGSIKFGPISGMFIYLSILLQPIFAEWSLLP